MWSCLLLTKHPWCFVSPLSDRVDKNGATVQTPEVTKLLFQERSLPVHKGRLRSRRSTFKSHVYPLFETPPLLGWNSVNNSHSPIPLAIMNLIRKINLFDPTLLL